MAVASYDDIIARVGGNYHATWPFYGDGQSTTGVLGGNNFAIQKAAWLSDLPALPSGVSGFIPTCIKGACAIVSTPRTWMVCEVISLGSLNISTNVFTDGSTFPTRTELGSSSQTYGPCYVEFLTALGGTPGSLTVTYVDQDGNAAETTTAQTMSATNANIGTTGFISLNSPDIGVTDITSAARTGGTAPTGTLQFWGIIPVAFLTVSSNGSCYTYSFHTQNFNWVNLSAGTSLRLFSWTAATAPGAHCVVGNIDIVGDS